jgi:ParB family chromosome partitioning protein
MPKLNLLKNVQAGTTDSRAVTLTVKDIPIGDIQAKVNVRQDDTEIDELAGSIRQYGLLQPITVFYVKDGYAVKFGHRRLMAYRKLYKEDPERFHSIRCILSDARNAELIQLVENVQRVDLSQSDLFHALNQLKAQGMTLKQIAEVMGKTEGYVKNLFVGVNELNRDTDLQNLIGNAGVTIRDIKETIPVKDKKERLQLLGDRKDGKITRAGMREKVRKLATPKPGKKTPDAPNGKKKTQKIPISIKAFPGMNKIIIYQLKGGSVERLMSLEDDLRVYFSANEKYRLEKAIPGKGGERCINAVCLTNRALLNGARGIVKSITTAIPWRRLWI